MEFELDWNDTLLREPNVDAHTDPRELVDIINMQAAQIRYLLRLLEEAQERLTKHNFKIEDGRNCDAENADGSLRGGTIQYQFNDSSSMDFKEEAIESDLENAADVQISEVYADAIEDNNDIEVIYAEQFEDNYQDNTSCNTLTEDYAEKFECTGCEEKFTSPERLSSHKIAFTKKSPYICPECDSKHGCIIALKHHLQAQHKRAIIYDCRMCDRSFKSSVGLLNHVVKELHVDDVDRLSAKECPLCSNLLKNARSLQLHMATHTRPHACQFCQRTFTNETSLKVHNANRHGGAKPYTCDMCKKKYATVRLLKKHVTVTHAKLDADELAQLKCILCGLQLKHKSSLKSHLLLHNGIKPFQCESCGKSFTTSTGLTLHGTTHSNERPYSCKVCEQRFKKDTHLKRHFVKHSQERRHRCESCPKLFKSSEHLREHRKTHNTVLRHACAICSKPFRTLAALNQHSLFHNGVRDFQCNYCEKQFFTKSNLQEHVKLHTGERPYSCKECGRTFTLSSNMKKHQKVHYRAK